MSMLLAIGAACRSQRASLSAADVSRAHHHTSLRTRIGPFTIARPRGPNYAITQVSFQLSSRHDAGRAWNRQDPVKLELITTLSGPAGYPARAFATDLARDRAQGRTVRWHPDRSPGRRRRPETGPGQQIADQIEDGRRQIFSGIVFGNIAAAVVPDVLDANTSTSAPTPPRRASPARTATRTISSPPGKMTGKAKARARSRPRSVTRRSS